MKKSRTKNSMYNVASSVFTNIFSILIGLVARNIFINILGSEYLGLNGLFTNVISMLGIVELGIGSAIIYNLYKPIANNDVDTIKSLMKFYKTSYHIIGFVVLLIGLLLIPFLPFIVGEVSLDVNINLIYFLFLIEIVFSYFLSYKRSLLNADQKNYFIQIIHLFYLLLLNFLQLLFLYYTKNFYLYLIIKIIMRVVENLVITIVVNYLYPFINENNVKPLDKYIHADIFKKVRALFLHQIGSFIINGTDNIIISRFLGLVTVGLYSNYYLIINSVQSVTKQIIDATTPSVGNLLVTESKDKQFLVFDRMRFLNFWIAVFSSTCIFVIMQPFIVLWIGKKYLLSMVVLFVLTLNMYQKTSRYTYGSFKTAAGIFYEDRFVPIIESILNIMFSVLLVRKIGLAGVFIGTILSGLSLWCYSYPKYVYKKLFDRSYFNYICETLYFIILFLIILFTTYYISCLFDFHNLVIKFLSNTIICLIIPNIVLLLIFFRDKRFKYFCGLFKKLFKR